MAALSQRWLDEDLGAGPEESSIKYDDWMKFQRLQQMDEVHI